MPTNNKSTMKVPAKPAKKSAPAVKGKASPQLATMIAPRLCLRGGARAVEFYKKAFGAVELFRLGDGASVVAKLSVDGAEFWLSGESPEHHNHSPETLGGITTRIFFTVADPDAVFARAIAAGAREIFPVGDEHGWRIGDL